MSRKNGLFITLEGGHGCGKSSIASLIVGKLRSLGLNVVGTNDQTGTVVGRELRRINLELTQQRISYLVEALLVAAARHQNVIEIIKPNLSQRRVVVCERFTDAFIAFQGFGRKLPMELLENINSVVADGIKPDLTILLDIDPRIALNRISNQLKHRIEMEPLNFHRKIREGYLSQSRKYPTRIKVLDANFPVEVVFENVWNEVKKIITKRRKQLC
ncbi:MAG: dTMP kinase [Promethearchaeota archaeon]